MIQEAAHLTSCDGLGKVGKRGRRLRRMVGHVARMPSDKLPRRMLSAWVYQAKGSSARKFDSKQTTYGGTVARYHFKYVLMNPSVHPDVREALTKESSTGASRPERRSRSPL